jgi:hypothetical protein
MPRHHKHPPHALLAALTALLMLAAALLPAWHGLLRAGSAAPAWVEVCTAEGSRWVAADGSAPAPAEHLTLEHCPLCLWQAHGIGLPPPPVSPIFISPAALRHAAPQGSSAVALAATRWALAQPRGPPASPSC